MNHPIVPLALITVIHVAINYKLSKITVFVGRRFAQRGHCAARKGDRFDLTLNPGRAAPAEVVDAIVGVRVPEALWSTTPTARTRCRASQLLFAPSSR